MARVSLLMAAAQLALCLGVPLLIEEPLQIAAPLLAPLEIDDALTPHDPQLPSPYDLASPRPRTPLPSSHRSRSGDVLVDLEPLVDAAGVKRDAVFRLVTMRLENPIDLVAGKSIDLRLRPALLITPAASRSGGGSSTKKKFELTARIGGGAYGDVYHARDSEGREYAIKVSKGPAYNPSLDAEARVHARVQGPDVVHVTGHGTIGEVGHDERALLVMDLITPWWQPPTPVVPPGGKRGKKGKHRYGCVRTARAPRVADLYNWMQGCDFHPRDALTVATQLTRGLARIHSKDLAHLDLKPENVLLGAGPTALLTDFGLSYGMLDFEEHLAGRGGRVGLDAHVISSYYAPPEVAHAEQTVNFGAYRSGERAAARAAADPFKADVFSLGVVLLEVLCGGGGKTPFEPLGRPRAWGLDTTTTVFMQLQLYGGDAKTRAAVRSGDIAAFYENGYDWRTQLRKAKEWDTAVNQYKGGYTSGGGPARWVVDRAIQDGRFVLWSEALGSTRANALVDGWFRLVERMLHPRQSERPTMREVVEGFARLESTVDGDELRQEQRQRQRRSVAAPPPEKGTGSDGKGAAAMHPTPYRKVTLPLSREEKERLRKVSKEELAKARRSERSVNY